MSPLYYKIVEIAIVWFFLSFSIGAFAPWKGKSPFLIFFLSLITTPIGGLVILCLMKDDRLPAKDEAAEKLMMIINAAKLTAKPKSPARNGQ